MEARDKPNETTKKEEAHDLHLRNGALLWQIRREIRYARRRAGWFDSVSRTSALFGAICGSAAFASFAGDWPAVGMVASALATLIALVCQHFGYPAALAACRASLRAHEALLAKAVAAGGIDMAERDRIVINRELHAIGTELAECFLARRDLLMCICENQVSTCDMEYTYPPSTKIPWWGHLVCQVWPWRWPATVIAYPSEAEPPSAEPEASAEADATPAEAAPPDSSSPGSGPRPGSAAPR